MAHALPAGVEGVHTGNPVRAAVLARAGRGLYPARRLSDEPAGDRRQPGRAHPVRCGARRRGGLPEACAPTCASAIRPAPRMPPASPPPMPPPASGRGEPLLHRHPAPPVRGAAWSSAAPAPRRGRYQRDRAPGDPDPLCRRHRRPPDRQRPRAGRGRGRDPDPRSRLDAEALAADRCRPGQPRSRQRMARPMRWPAGRPDAAERLAANGRALAERKGHERRHQTSAGIRPDPFRRHRRHRHVGHRRGADHAGLPRCRART
jgi:hypothetical protein